MIWEKKGLIYKPNAKYYWNQSHAQIPTVDMVNDRIWRIYYATRDKENRSYTSYIEVEAGNPAHVLYELPDPLLPLGELGTFDDCGIMPSWILTHNNKKYLYYIGWNVRTTIPYYNSIGLAISYDDGKTFHKLSKGPIIDRNHIEPHFVGTSCVIIEEGVWKNWYLSCTKWEMINGKPEPFYHIKYAESFDGIHWDRYGIVAIDYNTCNEGGIVRASVLKEYGIYRMWYSYRNVTDYRERGGSYRMGYAESSDGIRWNRLDGQSGISISDDDWDSVMIAYPYVISYKKQKFLFYNGNGFGKSGFGYAILNADDGAKASH